MIDEILSFPVIMAILNATPDSFYPPSRVLEKDEAHRALDFSRQGAAILDIGGESTRPGSTYVDTREEIKRVIPLIQKIRGESSILLSVDTRKREVAEKALDAGANWINDISALEDDPELASLIAERKVPVVLMHKQGTPENMQARPRYQDVVQDIVDYLSARVDFALKMGITEDQIVLDPGIGFGKSLDDNLKIIKYCHRFKTLGFPLLIGLSRKSFIQGIDPSSVEERLAGTVAAHVKVLEGGADILRVHDVLEARQTIAMVQHLGRV